MNQYKLRIFSIFIVTGILLFLTVLRNNADAFTPRTYEEKLIRNRAANGYTKGGTAKYNYQEIRSYNDGIEGEEIGNIEVEPDVREVHNVIIIKNGVKSKKDDLAIGKIEGKRPDSKLEIDNDVVIEGDVKASGKDIEIGTVGVGTNRQAKDVDTAVKITGDINAR